MDGLERNRCWFWAQHVLGVTEKGARYPNITKSLKAIETVFPKMKDH